MWGLSLLDKVINEKKTDFIICFVWLIIGFCIGCFCIGILFSSSGKIRETGTISSGSNVPQSTIDKQDSDIKVTEQGIRQQIEEIQSVNNNIGKSAEDVEGLLQQQNRILRELQSSFREGVQRVQKED